MLYAIVTLLVLILDQAVKYWTTVGIELNTGSVPLIPGVIGLVNIHNSGAAFGFLQNQNARWLFVFIAAVFVFVVILALGKNFIRAPLGRWSAVLVMAGAVGNCIDRVINGYVVDMFRLEFMNFAVFNVADIFITVCGILFCVYIIFSEDYRGKERADGEKPADRPRAAKKRPLPAEKPAPAVRSAEKHGEARAAEAPKPRPSEAPRQRPRRNTAEPAVRPAPDAVRGEDPFAEWSSLPPLTGARESVLAASSVSSEETVSKEPPRARPAEPKAEFSLEDILAEYASK